MMEWIGIRTVGVCGALCQNFMPCSQMSDQDTVVEIAFFGNRTLVFTWHLSFLSYGIFIFRMVVAFLTKAKMIIKA